MSNPALVYSSKKQFELRYKTFLAKCDFLTLRQIDVWRKGLNPDHFSF